MDVRDSARRVMRSLLSSRFAWLTSWLATQLLGAVCLAVRAPILNVEPAAYLLGAALSLPLWYLLGLSRQILKTRWVVWTYAALTSLVITLFLVTSAGIYSFFREFVAGGMVVYSSARTYFALLSQHLVGPMGVGFVGTWVFLGWIWARPAPEHFRVPRAAHWAMIAVGVVGIAGLSFGPPPSTLTRGLLPPDAALATALSEARSIDAMLLHAPNRRDVDPADAPTPYNVLVIVNESWRRAGLRHYEQERARSMTPKLASWVGAQGSRGLVFRRHFSTSAWTEFAVSSLLTGVGPQGELERFHRAPLAWHWAEAAGMYTIFTSPELYGVRNLDEFLFERDPPDRWVTARETGARLSNDSGVDDFITLDSFLQFVRRAPEDRPLFAVLSTNATHVPHLVDTTLRDIDPSGETRYAKASKLVDRQIQEALGAFRKTGRLEDTFVIVTADHGSTDKRYHDLPRIYSMYDDVLRVPFFVRIPERFVRRHPEAVDALRANRRRMTSHIDLVPTLVDILKLEHTAKNREIADLWHGKSLLEPIPVDRTFVAFTSDGFNKWGYDALGIYWPGWRFVASKRRGSQLYNVRQDPHQQRNLWPEIPAHAAERIDQTLRDHPRIRKIYRDVILVNKEQDRFGLDAYERRERR